MPKPSSCCLFLVEPRVVMASTCVCPLVNRAEPWVRGRSPISQLMGRTSVKPRPLMRCAFSRMLVLISVLTLASKAASISSSGNDSPSCSTHSFFSSLSASSWFDLSDRLSAWASLSSIIGETAEITSGAISLPGASALGLPQACWSCSWSLIISWFASCPNLIASIATSSETSRAPASTITIASLVLATTRSSRLSSSWTNVGFNISSLLI